MASDTNDEMTKTLGLDESLDELWERAAKHLREKGIDPDALLAQAAANMRAYRALPVEEQRRLQDQATAEWAAWEATVDDHGNPIKSPSSTG